VQVCLEAFSFFDHANSDTPTCVIFSAKRNAGSVSRPRHSTRRQGLLLPRLIRGRMQAKGRPTRGTLCLILFAYPPTPKVERRNPLGARCAVQIQKPQSNFYKISYHPATNRSRQTSKTFICNDLTQVAGCPRLAHRLHLPISTHCTNLSSG
jgi:hypothetical protein